MIMYRIMFFLMVLSFGYVSMYNPDWKMRVCALLFNIANIIMFWR
jgi:hypothetical protein